MNYSFFYTRGGAAEIRGVQVADAIGGRKNPKSGYENDICIYVKFPPPHIHPKRTYYDIVDTWKAAPYLQLHPEVIGICQTEYNRKYLTDVFKLRNLIVIPEHHCNFERRHIPEREIKTVGIMGSISSFQYPIDTVRSQLRQIGLELHFEQNYWEHFKNSRLAISDYYMKMDIQVVWRPKRMDYYYCNPLKLYNAGSFGIPTVAYPEHDYVDEWHGNFCSVNTIEYLIAACAEMKRNRKYYNRYAQRAWNKAQKNHIDRISKLYLQLT
jgi:hypothetical protein